MDILVPNDIAYISTGSLGPTEFPAVPHFGVRWAEGGSDNSGHVPSGHDNSIA